MKTKPTFIGKKWTIEIETNNGLVLGYITDAISAKTYNYSLSQDGDWQFDFMTIAMIPCYVLKKLFALMRKEVKRIKGKHYPWDHAGWRPEDDFYG